MREPSDEVPDGTVLVEFRKGFVLGDRLLRPAMVKVIRAAVCHLCCADMVPAVATRAIGCVCGEGGGDLSRARLLFSVTSSWIQVGALHWLAPHSAHPWPLTPIAPNPPTPPPTHRCHSMMRLRMPHPHRRRRSPHKRRCVTDLFGHVRHCATNPFSHLRVIGSSSGSAGSGGGRGGRSGGPGRSRQACCPGRDARVSKREFAGCEGNFSSFFMFVYVHVWLVRESVGYSARMYH